VTETRLNSPSNNRPPHYNWIVEFSIRQPVLANLAFVIIMVVGLWALFTLPRDINPDVSFETAVVITPYPGATPEDVEKLVTIPLEDEIRNVKDLNRVYSRSEENLSVIVVEFDTGTPIKERVRDLRDEVDKVKDLPEETEDTQIIELDTGGIPMISVILSSGSIAEHDLKEIAEDLQDELEDIPGVSSVNLAGVREREIWISADRSRLERYRLSLSAVAEAVSRRNRNIPAGTVDIGEEEALVRTVGEYRSVEEIPGTIVLFFRPGHTVRVRDVATVEDTFEDPSTESRINGRPAVSLSVLKEKEADAHTVVAAAKAIVTQRMSLIPSPPRVDYVGDMTVLIDQSLGVLWNNALIGLVLVIFTLMFFVGTRNAVLAGLGIPFSFLATFAVMKWTGMSINGVSIFALVLVLGIVVDDAIIVIENIYRYLEKGLAPLDAARYAGEVAAPVIASVTSTMAAFLPMLIMTGIIGEFLGVIPKIVTIALAASLLEALFILPSHIADFGRARKRPPLGDPVFRFLLKIYRRLIIVSLGNRIMVLTLVLVLAVVGVMLVPYLGIDMFPDDDIPQFSVRLEAPEGTPLDATSALLARVEEKALTLPAEEIKAVFGRTGVIYQENDETIRGTNVGEVMVELVVKDERRRSIDEIIDDLRGRIGVIPGIRSVEFHKIEGGPPEGAPVAVQVKGRTLDGVEPLVMEIKRILAEIPGTKDIKDNYIPGKDLLTIEVDPERAARYGLSPALIGIEVRAANDGRKASVFRDGDEEVDIIVKLEKSDRNSAETLRSLRIAAPSGEMVPLENVAEISLVPGPSKIRHLDFERTVTVTADLDKEKTTSVRANQAFAAEVPALLARFPGFTIEQGGEYKKTQESFESLGRAFLIALLVIYTILGIQFQSFLQPLVILLTVPFAFIGVITGLLVNGHPFSLVSMVAVVALAGIVVNDSLVLVDFINKRRASGISLYRSIVRSGIVRMRPVIMTSLTTIVGLLPMSLALGGESPVWEPLATSLIWGLVFSTFLTLFVIPVAYSLLAEWTRNLKPERAGPGMSPAYPRRKRR
jgi:CzcA family heavy metal efflux pump